MPDNINDENFEEPQATIYHRIYRRLNKIIPLEQFLQSNELSMKSNGFIGLMVEKDVENPDSSIYLLNYIESTGTIILDLEIKLQIDTKNKLLEVVYMNDGFKTVYTNEKNKNKIHKFFLKFLWILEEGRKECKK